MDSQDRYREGISECYQVVAEQLKRSGVGVPENVTEGIHDGMEGWLRGLVEQLGSVISASGYTSLMVGGKLLFRPVEGGNIVALATSLACVLHTVESIMAAHGLPDLGLLQLVIAEADEEMLDKEVDIESRAKGFARVLGLDPEGGEE